jgi:hypothetical protein
MPQAEAAVREIQRLADAGYFSDAEPFFLPSRATSQRASALPGCGSAARPLGDGPPVVDSM